MAIRLRILVGVLTTAAFAVIGGTMIAGGRTVVGAVVLLLAAFRLRVLITQVRAARDDGEDDA